MTAMFRVTVEDLETGEKQAMEVSEGDYMLIPFAPCYLDGVQWYANGTRVLTVKNHRPAAKPREVQPAPRYSPHRHGVADDCEWCRSHGYAYGDAIDPWGERADRPPDMYAAPVIAEEPPQAEPEETK